MKFLLLFMFPLMAITLKAQTPEYPEVPEIEVFPLGDQAWEQKTLEENIEDLYYEEYGPMVENELSEYNDSMINEYSE